MPLLLPHVLVSAPGRLQCAALHSAYCMLLCMVSYQRARPHARPSTRHLPPAACRLVLPQEARRSVRGCSPRDVKYVSLNKDSHVLEVPEVSQGVSQGVSNGVSNGVSKEVRLG